MQVSDPRQWGTMGGHAATAAIYYILYMAKIMWTPVRPTSHSKIMGVNMVLIPLLMLQQPPLFWEDFPLDVGTLLRGFASIQPQEHS